MSDIQTGYFKGYVSMMIFVLLLAIVLWIWNLRTHKFEKNKAQFWLGLLAVLYSIAMLKPNFKDVLTMYRPYGRILCAIYAIVTFFPYFRQGKREALLDGGSSIKKFLMVYIKGIFRLEITIYGIWSVGILYFAKMGKFALNPRIFMCEMGTIFFEAAALFSIYAAFIMHAEKIRDIFISVMAFAIGMPLLERSMEYFVNGRLFEYPEYIMGIFHVKDKIEICSKIFLPFYPKSWMDRNDFFDSAWNLLYGLRWMEDYEIKIPYDTYLILFVFILLFLGAAIFGVKKKSRKVDNAEAYCNGFFPYPFLIGSLLLGLLPSVFSAKHWLTWILVVIAGYYAIHTLLRVVIDFGEWYWKEISIILFAVIVMVLGVIDFYDKTEAFGIDHSWFAEHKETEIECITFDGSFAPGRANNENPEYLQACISLLKQVDQNKREERKEKHHSYYQDSGRDYLLNIDIESEKDPDDYLLTGEYYCHYLISREELEAWEDLYQKWENPFFQ